MKHKFLWFLSLILAGFYISLSAQVSKGELKKGEPVSSEIINNESHRYQLQLEKDQFALIELFQKGVDILITSYGPNGKALDFFDSPNGANGPEFITVFSDEAGSFELEIRPYDESKGEGFYDLSILKIEPRASTNPGKIDQLMTLWDRKDSPGAAIGVVENGQITFKKGYGMSNLEYDIPVTPSTIFHIASVSKQFTAFAVLMLEEEGKLSMDDDVREYIPEVPDFGETITLRHLVHHTSGLRDQWNLLALAGWRLDDVITRDQILKLISLQKGLNFPPGEEFLYCNTGFTLLAEVVARVSGKTFAEFTKERIFDPLNMSHTLFYDDHQKIVKNRAYSYFQDTTGLKKSVLSYANAGATSLFTTVEDLSLWAMNFEEPVVGNSSIIEKMKIRGVLNNGDTIDYAMGQSISKYKGLRMIGHGGADAGYRTFLGRFPDQHFAVTVLSNEASFNPSGIALDIAEIYLENEMEDDTNKEAEPSAEDVTSSGISIEEDTLKAYAGEYELENIMIISIQLVDGALSARIAGQPDMKLDPLSNTKFQVSGVDVYVTFHRDPDDQVSLMKVHQGEQVTSLPKMEPFDANELDLSAFEGRYYSEELLTMYEFIVSDGSLVARHQRHPDIALTPVKKDRFSGDVWFFGQVEMVRDQTGTVTGCKVSSGRVRNLIFNKLD